MRTVTATATLSPSASNSTCDPQSCRWRPYSNSNDFQTNALLILIILFFALISAIALNAAIRCFLRPPHRLPQPQPEDIQRKPNLNATAASTLVFSSGIKLAGTETECAICLSEFEEGEGIQVLGTCKHGFHVQCIQEWLSSSHFSCPTCRRSCLLPPPEASV